MTDDTTKRNAEAARRDLVVRRRSDSRVSARTLPGCPMFCSIGAGCVYRRALICDEPRINKGNGDAKCHRMNNRDVLAALSATRPNGGTS